VPRLTHGLRGDRAMFHAVTTNIDNGSLDLDTAAGGNGSSGMQGQAQTAPPAGTLPKAQALMLDHFGKMIAADKVEREGRVAAFCRDSGPEGHRQGALLVNLLMPAVDKWAPRKTACGPSSARPSWPWQWRAIPAR